MKGLRHAAFIAVVALGGVAVLGDHASAHQRQSDGSYGAAHSSFCEIDVQRPHNSKHRPQRVVGHANTECFHPGDRPTLVRACLYKKFRKVDCAKNTKRSKAGLKLRASPNVGCGRRGKTKFFAVRSYHVAYSHHGKRETYRGYNDARVTCR